MIGFIAGVFAVILGVFLVLVLLYRKERNLRKEAAFRAFEDAVKEAIKEIYEEEE